MVYYSSCNRKKSAMSMRRMLEQVVSTTCIQCCHPAAQVLVLVLQNGLALLRVHRRIHVLLRSVPLCVCLSVCLMVTPQSFCNGGAIRHLLVTGHFGPETVRRCSDGSEVSGYFRISVDTEAEVSRVRTVLGPMCP